MTRRLIDLSLILMLVGCASQKSSPAPETVAGTARPAAPPARIVRGQDGTEGEIIGTPGARSKFARLQIGMTERQVEALIGPPTDADTHITGKSFIPFYFAGDTHRLETFYKGEGQLTFSPSHFAGQANTLIRIIADTTETGVPH